jgi:hypothetical protein
LRQLDTAVSRRETHHIEDKGELQVQKGRLKDLLNVTDPLLVSVQHLGKVLRQCGCDDEVAQDNLHILLLEVSTLCSRSWHLVQSMLAPFALEVGTLCTRSWNFVQSKLAPFALEVGTLCNRSYESNIFTQVGGPLQQFLLLGLKLAGFEGNIFTQVGGPVQQCLLLSLECPTAGLLELTPLWGHCGGPIVKLADLEGYILDVQVEAVLQWCLPGLASPGAAVPRAGWQLWRELAEGHWLCWPVAGCKMWCYVWAESRKDCNKHHRALRGNLKVVTANITALSNLRLALAGGPDVALVQEVRATKQELLAEAKALGYMAAVGPDDFCLAAALAGDAAWVQRRVVQPHGGRNYRPW